MSVVASFKNLDKRFAWSFLGFMLAIIFGGVTVYTEFFRVNTPSLVVEVLNDTNVLDVKEDVNELKVYYGEVDIKNLNQTLSVLFLRIKNNGGAPILNGYYDKKYPLNIILQEGKFLKVEQFSSTNDYLSSSAIPLIENEQKISLPEIILEPSESYTIKILALHSADSIIEFKVSGKIAGIKEISLVKNNSSEQKVSYWDQVVSGNVWVQLGRFPVYFFGLPILLLILVAPIAITSEILTKRKRSKVIKQYKTYDSNEITNSHTILFDAYIEDGLSALVEAKEAIIDKTTLIEFLDNDNSESENEELIVQTPASRLIYDDDISDNIKFKSYRIKRVKKLLNKLGILTKNETNEVTINKEIEIILNKFIDFVIIKES